MALEGHEGAHRDAEGADLVGPPEVRKVYDEDGRCDVGPQLAQQPDRRLGRASGRDEIVDEDHPLARQERIAMDLHLVEAVFQRVADARDVARQLALLAHRDEPGRELVGDRAAENEAARLDPRHLVYLRAGPGLYELV